MNYINEQNLLTTTKAKESCVFFGDKAGFARAYKALPGTQISEKQEDALFFMFLFKIICNATLSSMNSENAAQQPKETMSLIFLFLRKC